MCSSVMGASGSSLSSRRWAISLSKGSFSTVAHVVLTCSISHTRSESSTRRSQKTRKTSCTHSRLYSTPAALASSPSTEVGSIITPCTTRAKSRRLKT